MKITATAGLSNSIQLLFMAYGEVLHYDAAGQLKLGRQLGKALATLRHGK